MRTIPTGATVLTLLKEWKLRAKHKKRGDLVFPNSKGGYTSHDKGQPVTRFKPSFESDDHREAMDVIAKGL